MPVLKALLELLLSAGDAVADDDIAVAALPAAAAAEEVEDDDFDADDVGVAAVGAVARRTALCWPRPDSRCICSKYSSADCASSMLSAIPS